MSARFVLRQVGHDIRASLFLRPALIAFALSVLSVVVVEADLRGYTHGFPLLLDEPSAAAAILGGLASSVMSVVSIVYSVLLMSVTLASMQFSPRVISTLVRDTKSQNVLGIFAGTFIFALLGLRGVRSDPPFAPPLTMLVAMTLAVTSIGALIYFIDHMAREIQVNHLIAATAEDAVKAIDAEMRGSSGHDNVAPPPVADALTVKARRSGYVQLVDIGGMRRLARHANARIDVVRAPGDFVAEGSIVARISPAENAGAIVEGCRRAFDIGWVRTVQQDVAFGLRLIVDIGLKAISPAVNDPSTCSTCIDHLSALLRRLATQDAGALTLADDGELRVVLPRPAFKDLVDLAFNQLRQYGRSDLAVANRILHALDVVAEATKEPARLHALQEQARLLMAGLNPTFAPEDRVELEAAYAAFSRRSV